MENSGEEERVVNCDKLSATPTNSSPDQLASSNNDLASNRLETIPSESNESDQQPAAKEMEEDQQTNQSNTKVEHLIDVPDTNQLIESVESKLKEQEALSIHDDDHRLDAASSVSQEMQKKKAKASKSSDQMELNEMINNNNNNSNNKESDLTKPIMISSGSSDLSSSIRNLNNHEWIESGTSKIGLKFERLMKQYKQLSRQKKYLYLLLYILAFLLIVSMLLLAMFLLSGPRTQFIYLQSIDSSYSSSNLTTNRSLADLNDTTTTTTLTTALTTNTTTFKKLGLAGDLCTKIFGDCEKFMECKKVGVHWNISNCQCIQGYQMDYRRFCRGLVGSFCDDDDDCYRNLQCDQNYRVCKCKKGFYQRDDKTCFAKYNTTCETDDDCLRNAECIENGNNTRVCKCSTKKRTVFRPDQHPYFQCKTLVGSSCQINNDCIENAKCNKYCSCRETELFSETKEFFCEDLCSNKTVLFKNGNPLKFPHPRKCGFYFTCLPRDLDICPSKYRFDFESQSCNSSSLC